ELDGTRTEVILGNYPFHRLGNRLEIRIIVEEHPAGILRPAGLLSHALFVLLGLFLAGGRARTEIHADRAAEERTTDDPPCGRAGRLQEITPGTLLLLLIFASQLILPL